MNASSPDRRGILLATIAYSCWIVYPIYFKFLLPTTALEIMAQRLCWSLLFMLLLLTGRRHWSWLPTVLRDGTLLLKNVAAGIVLATNWLVYIWAVNSGHILESSLGYFINPLVSVLIGAFLLGERLRTAQWLIVALAGMGVLYLAFGYGQMPWLSLAVACSFAIYGLLKKTSTLDAMQSLTLETAFLFPFGLVYLIYLQASNQSHFLHVSRTLDTLLVLSGPLTAIPLLLYSAGARRIPLYMLGLLQYIAPTGQFFIGVLLYEEAFPQYKQIGFGIIWLALLCYWLEGWWQRRMATNGSRWAMGKV